MLVITRREGEEVVIGDPANPLGIVRIASIRGDRVRIAFDFPREVQVHRREVADQIKDEGGPRADDAEGGASGAKLPKRPPTPPSTPAAPAATDRPGVIGQIRPKVG
jgi:carbon storage regulator